MGTCTLFSSVDRAGFGALLTSGLASGFGHDDHGGPQQAIMNRISLLDALEEFLCHQEKFHCCRRALALKPVKVYHWSNNTEN